MSRPSINHFLRTNLTIVDVELGHSSQEMGDYFASLTLSLGQ